MKREMLPARSYVVWHRYNARKYIALYQQFRDELRTMERSIKKYNQQGVIITLLDARVREWIEKVLWAKRAIALIGGCLCTALDKWQENGATLKDLCNLCNASYERTLCEIPQKRQQKEKFSALMFVYHLDYLHDEKSEWLDWKTDAPMTHAITEYHCYQIENTPGLTDALLPGLFEAFPEIAASAIYPYTDQEGVTRFFDADGVEVGAAEG